MKSSGDMLAISCGPSMSSLTFELKVWRFWKLDSHYPNPNPSMKFQSAPNAWSCLPTAFATVLSIDVNWLISVIGHDGSEIYWPGQPEPLRRRGFHIQELIEVVFACGYSVTPFEAMPVSRGATDIQLSMRNSPEIRILSLAANQPGIATGLDTLGRPHAVAWDGFKVIDCNRRITKLEEFGLQVFWAICLKAKQRDSKEISGIV